MSVQKVKELNPKRDQPDERLPQFPFMLVVVAPRKSGKTNMVVDALLDEDKYNGKFDVIIIWSRTYHHDSKWRNIDLPPGSVFTVFDENEANKILKVAEAVSKEVYVNILIIVDDMIADSIMSPRRMGFFEGLATRGRHANVSVIIITQQYMALSPSVRNNSTNSIFFRIRNGQELDKITRENRESLTPEAFTALYNAATEEPFAFLHVNNQQADPKKRFWKNWDTLLQIEDDE